MRLGAIVLQSRPWNELAEDFRTIEQIGYDVAGGRLVLGLGAGSPHCAAADRAAHPTPKQMADRYADLVEGVREVWAGASAWHGRDAGFEGLQTLALPEGGSAPFLLLAAHGSRGVDLVARFGDGWSTYGGPAAVALPREDYWTALAGQQAAVTAACERHDRDPALLRRSLLLGFGVDRPTGSLAAFTEAADRGEAAGFHELVVYWSDGEPGGRFYSDPQVHADGVAAVRGARGLG